MSLDQYGQFDADRKAAWMNKEAVKRGFSNATNWQNADAQGFQAADGQYRQQFPAGGAAQRGSAMPDATPADAPPFYMKSTQVLDAKIQGKAATVDQVRAILTNPQNGIKAEELKWTGALQAAERLAKENNGKVPKDALLQYLADDGAVRLEEVTMGGVRKQWTQADIEALERQAQRTRDFSEYERAVLEYEDQQLGSDANNTGNQTRYGQYQLAGGENYREVVLAMPAGEMREAIIGPANNFVDWADADTLSPAGLRTLERSGHRIEMRLFGKVDYTSTHFDTPNYVAHMRLNERTDAAGKRGLFLEEIQSDRHQQGREKGYKEDANSERDALRKRYNDAVARRNAARAALEASTDTGDVRDATDRTLIQAFQNAQMNMEQASGERRRSEAGSIPDAPFRKDWPTQMFKRALADAVGSGKEWIGWTTGETQAARYDLSQHFDRIRVHKIESPADQAGWHVEASGNDSLRKVARTDQELADTIGKELADKAIKQITTQVEKDAKLTQKQRAATTADPYEADFTGVDLRVGGEGMKGFYDQILPKEISKYVKQWGGQVEKSRMGKEPSKAFTDAVAKFEEAKRKYGATSQQATEAMMAIPNESGGGGVAGYWRVNITPQMRSSIKKAGQALFVGGMAAVVAEDQPEQ
jgi:hypothetical protein